MGLQLFITEKNEFFTDMNSEVDQGTHQWLMQNKIYFANQNDHSVKEVSKHFIFLDDAIKWILKKCPDFHFQEMSDDNDILPGEIDPEWAQDYLGSKINLDYIEQDNNRWSFSGDEFVYHYGETIPPYTYFTVFPPQGGNCTTHSISVTIFLKTEQSIISSISYIVSIQDNWGDWQQMDVTLFPPDINYSLKIINLITCS